MKRVALIPARLDSSRLPGKALREVLGKPLLSFLVSRLRQSASIDQVALTTTSRTCDTPLAAWGASEGLEVFRGELDDVLGRFLAAARVFDADVVFRANGDSPLLSPEWVDKGFSQLECGDFDFVTGKTRFTKLPMGAAGEWITTRTLERLNALAHTVEDREHVTSYVFSHPDDFKWASLEPIEVADQREELRLVVDTEEDLERFRMIVRQIGNDIPSCSVRQIIEAAAEVANRQQEVKL